jgi:hypothetical protein
MANQPLDAAFAARQDNRKKSSRRFIVLGALFVGLAGTAASVYAANININSSGAISFAQGSQIVASCDVDSAQTTLASEFDAAGNDGAGLFTVDTVTITALDDDCIGASLEVFLTDGAEVLGSEQVTVQDGDEDINSTVVDFTLDAVNAESVTDVAVEIRG